MFKENKYTKWYYSIIENAKMRNLSTSVYTEDHHIIPKCLGGENTKNNLVKLTSREHFICHRLLTKMNEDHRLKFAFVMMSVENPKQKRNFKITSHTYQYLKECNDIASSIRSKGKQKHNLSKIVAHDPISQESRMFKNLEEIPKNWIKGFSQKRKNAIIGKNKNKIYYYNKITNQVIALNENDAIPIGFEKGNPHAATRSSFGTTMFYDPLTFEVKRIKNTEIPPKNWIKGSPYIWVNNGKERKQILKNEKIPEGFVKGQLKIYKGKNKNGKI